MLRDGTAAKALQKLEAEPHLADVPKVKEETQPLLNREKVPPDVSFEGEEQAESEPIGGVFGRSVKAKMTERKKDVEAVLGARERSCCMRRWTFRTMNEDRST